MSAFGGGQALQARCSACNITGAIWEVWGQPLCPTHHAEWLRDDRFSAEAINGALGLSSTPEEFTKLGHDLYCAEATKRTVDWVRELRRRAA